MLQMSQNYEPGFKKKIVRLHLEVGSFLKGLAEEYGVSKASISSKENLIPVSNSFTSNPLQIVNIPTKTTVPVPIETRKLSNHPDILFAPFHSFSTV